MKQKIVIKVAMNCEKCKAKAMKIAAVADGVTKVEIQGNDKDQLAVIGDEVDPVSLTKLLRKKFQYANILSVQEEKEKEEDEKKKVEETVTVTWPTISYCQYPPILEPLAYDPCSTSFCTIL